MLVPRSVKDESQISFPSLLFFTYKCAGGVAEVSVVCIVLDDLYNVVWHASS